MAALPPYIGEPPDQGGRVQSLPWSDCDRQSERHETAIPPTASLSATLDGRLASVRHRFQRKIAPLALCRFCQESRQSEATGRQDEPPVRSRPFGWDGGGNAVPGLRFGGCDGGIDSVT